MLIVEGEKCAAALKGLGFQAVTVLGGSQCAIKGNWEAALKGFQHCTILPDNDAAGLKFAQEAYRRFKALPIAKIAIAFLPGLPIAGDVCDYISAIDGFHDWNGFTSLIEHRYRETAIHALTRDLAALEKAAPPEWDSINSESGLIALPYSALKRLNLPQREVLLSPWLMQRSINMVFADRGIGKTYFCLSCAVALATGKTFIKYQAVQPVRVMYLDGEMQASLLLDRLKSLLGDAVPDIFIVTPDCQHERDMPNLARTEGLDEVDDLIKQINPDVIFVDNLSTFIRSGNENEGESWLPVQEWAIRQRSAGRAIVFVHHTNKEGGQRGSSRKEDVMDTVIQLKRPDDYLKGSEGARFEIHFTKNRNLYGEDIAPIEAKLEIGQEWSWQNISGDYEQSIELLKAGIAQSDICEELGLNKSTLSRWKRKAQSEGRL